MYYQNILIKRKEHFGLIWLAAHCPRKISKTEVLQLDLSKKCKELINYIGNKKSAKAKISLLVSSHLMKGLVIILHKKNVYLYDDLMNLKQQLTQSYTLNEPALKKKSTKNQPIDQNVITLKENYPDLLEMSCIETLVTHVLDKTGTRYRNVTMSDADDFMSNSALMIPVDYDYTMDSFGGNFNDAPFLIPMIEDYTIAKMQSEQGVHSLIEDNDVREKPGVTSTGKKPPTVSKRAPFGDMTNIEGIREKDATAAYDNNMQDGQSESLMPPVGDAGLDAGLARPNEHVTTDMLEPGMLPNLFEPTVLEHMPESTGIYDNNAYIEDVSQIQVRGMTKTFSAEITALKENQLRKRELLIERISRKRKNLIIDTVTEITVSAADKVKRMYKQYPKDSDEYNEQKQERFEYFREKNPWLTTRHDFQVLDLFKEPIGSLATRTTRHLNSHQLKLSINVRHMMDTDYKCMSTGAVNDDEYFYSDQAIMSDERQTASEPSSNLIMPNSNEQSSSMAEDKRQTEKLPAQRRVSTLTNKKSQRDSLLPHPDSKAADQVPLEPLPEELLPNVQPQESFVQAGFVLPQDQTIFQGNFGEQQQQQQTSLMEIEGFEALIIQSMNSESNAVILQDLIMKSEIPEKCRLMQKPRKFFAAKMFSAALILAGGRAISLEQSAPNDSISMRIIAD